MKMTLGLAGVLAACVLAAAPADSSIAFDSSNFEVLPIGQGKGEKLYFAKGTLSVKAQNGSPFICGTARHPVTPGGIARASVKAKGKGKAGIMIYSFGPDGKCVGWQTTGVRDLKGDAPVTLSSEVRISPHYTGGREIKSIAWGIYALRGCEGVFSDYQAAYEEKTPNPTLKPAKSERGGIIVRTRKLTEQAKALVTNRTIHVIPTKNIPQGFAAALAFNPDASSEENKTDMIHSMDNVKAGQVTYAVRSTSVNGFDLKEGDIIGLDDKKILAKGDNVDDTLVALIGKLKESSHEIITLYYGKDVKEEEAEALAAKVSEQFPDCDVDFHYGGQPIYYYLVSLE